LSAGTWCFIRGDLTGFFYLILSGAMELESTGAAGEKRVITLYSGDAFGWSSVLDGERKHSQARALSEVVALAFDGSELRKACDQDPEFGYALTKRLLSIVAGRLEAGQPHTFSPVGESFQPR
jgi:CRP/FNR family cyclic AMP-dependent transcriptional regulator